MIVLFVGAYLLTQKEVFLDRGHMTQLCAAMLAGKDGDMRIRLPPPAIFRVWHLLLFIVGFFSSNSSKLFFLEVQ